MHFDTQDMDVSIEPRGLYTHYIEVKGDARPINSLT